jgi:hypothetical protein
LWQQWYQVLLLGTDPAGDCWVVVPALPSGAREPEGRRVETRSAGEGFKVVRVRWRAPESRKPPDSPGALR